MTLTWPSFFMSIHYVIMRMSKEIIAGTSYFLIGIYAKKILQGTSY